MNDQSNGQELKIHGIFDIEHWRNGLLLARYQAWNKIANEGKQDILDQYFAGSGAACIDPYIGLIDDTWNDFTNSDPDPSSNEFTTYTGNRPAIVFDAATIGTGGDAGYIVKYNSTSNYCIFTIDTGVVNQVLDGIFVCDVNTGAWSLIWCSAAFGNVDVTPVPITVNTADVLKVQYKIRIPI